jgi:hypothetical protein
MPRIVMLCICLLSCASLRADETDTLTFERHIRPIFRTHCFDCHGATEELKGGLDLRLVRFLMKGGESGPALAPRGPDESYLFERISNGEMPPREKKLSAAEIETIRQWIASGAATARPEPETLAPGLGISVEERSFWSFQPIRRPELPDLSSLSIDARIRSPIDALIVQQATQEADDETVIRFLADAEPRTLVKRAYFDLLGLPPSPDEMNRWLDRFASDSANASAADEGRPHDVTYAQLIDHLLESPHYGERWARHWLDVAGYADSEGYTVADTPRAWAWKYRDWVIRTLNDDMPFDQFITHQLAGDELAGPIKGDLTSEQVELLTATGFLRMAADGTGSGADNPEGRNQVIVDTLKIVGTSLLGLSVQCAQCHDHRYDPIPQTDYYALRAVFEPALDWQAWKNPNARRISLYTQADRKQAADIEAEAQKVAAERATQQAEYMRQALEQELMKFAEPLRTQLSDAYQTAGDKRTAAQKLLLAQNPSLSISPGVLYQYLPKAAEELKKFDQRINEIRAKKPIEQFIRALVEPAKHVPDTKLFFRGDHRQPQQSVIPAALTVTAPEDQRRVFKADDETLATTGRRLAFARWLTSGRHPILSRVIVNRVWMHHFGQALVKTPADFGKLGAKPSHPELLDWLADQFVRDGWSMKKLHRTIMLSTTWRQTKANSDEEYPSAQSPFRPPLVRLEAEAIRDRVLAATGHLDRKLYGAPVAIKDDDAGQIVVDGSQTRRSLYIQVRRSRPVAMLQAFDAPVMETNCESRPNSTVATQSLMLINGRFTLDQAAKLAERVAADAQGDAEAVRGQVSRAWDLALCRPPTEDELLLATRFVTQQISTLETTSNDKSPTQQAMTNLCQALISCNEFLYVD